LSDRLAGPAKVVPGGKAQPPDTTLRARQSSSRDLGYSDLTHAALGLENEKVYRLHNRVCVFRFQGVLPQSGQAFLELAIW
jgi:hypothetical protein